MHIYHIYIYIYICVYLFDRQCIYIVYICIHLFDRQCIRIYDMYGHPINYMIHVCNIIYVCMIYIHIINSPHSCLIKWYSYNIRERSNVYTQYTYILYIYIYIYIHIYIYTCIYTKAAPCSPLYPPSSPLNWSYIAIDLQ